ncbi:AAA family ATPase [Orrella sp. 11846]|uniref:AAA family ATPase n=1 Tax=Orrella sp. 11846 TaxID=3409913 RepID=UPI003B5BBC99
MKLKRIALTNYRRFENFAIDFDPELTVIAARNGQGKTTVLEAVAASLGPFVGAFDYGRSEHIRPTDARYTVESDGFQNIQNFPVIICAEINEPTTIQWQRALKSIKGRTTTKDAAPLADWGKQLQESLRTVADVSLPIMRYYSSKRLWVSHKNVSSKAILTQSRTAGYEDCLSSLSSFVQLQEWTKKATHAVHQQREIPGYEKSNLGPRLQGMQQAVDTVMRDEGWHNFHYSFVFDELAMVHPDHGALPISMLSDGVRAMISLAADLALRCVRLNGYLGEMAPQKSTGIVLIDEVDLHLHPAWQQRVLEALRRAFPKLQFIVSSHSPQVLSTVARRHVRVLFKDTEGQWQAKTPSQEVLGLESAIALNDVMGVNPIPPVEEARLISSYITLIENGLQDQAEGQSLRQKLIDIYGAEHSVLLDADRLIRFQSYKLRQADR